MTRMTGPDCVVMCNLINTHTHIHTHTHTHKHTHNRASALIEELKTAATEAKRDQ